MNRHCFLLYYLFFAFCASAQTNIALHRTARATSAYDYNLTAQLLTDGIIDAAEPVRLEVLADGKPLPRAEREWAIGGNDWCRNLVRRELHYRWHGMTVCADQVRFVGSIAYNPDCFDSDLDSDSELSGKSSKSKFQVPSPKSALSLKGRGWQAAYRCDGLPGRASRDSVHSDPNKQTEGTLLPTRRVDVTIDLGGVRTIDDLCVRLDMRGAEYMRVNTIQFLRDGREVSGVLPSSRFSSAWMSAVEPSRHHEVTIDMGRDDFTAADVRLHWIPGFEAKRTSINKEGSVLRIVMDGREQVALTEVEVFQPDAIPALQGRDKSPLREDLGGLEISRAGSDQWIPATVPGTVLMSYVNAGAVPDPNFADEWSQISESYFLGDFWYRGRFRATRGGRQFLNLDGINWRAEIILNGQRVGDMAGAFIRGRFDITDLLRYDEENVLLVHILPNAHPGAVKEKGFLNTDYNGGALGADNPTFHPTIGWDWITTVRGRNIGIWDDIYLTREGDVTLCDPVVTTVLDDSLRATMTPAVRLRNNSPRAVTGTLTGRIGDIAFSRRVALMGGSESEAVFSPEDFAQLRDREMQLWWPNGTAPLNPPSRGTCPAQDGGAFLYDASFTFRPDYGTPSDTLTYKAGIREVTYSEVDTRLQIYVNRQRINPKGGNWGFPEQNLRYTAREYDIAVGYHREMNMNMIRNWVGQTADREFYEACDRHGILVWQDFWLANPADGPNPTDEAMFMANARDYVYRIRRHPCVALYCGRNEGYPPASLDSALRSTVAELYPSPSQKLKNSKTQKLSEAEKLKNSKTQTLKNSKTQKLSEAEKLKNSPILYISSSADEGVSGHGPYWAVPRDEYFTRQTGRLHTERGMPCVMNYESLRRTLRDSDLWPQGAAWGQHDYCQQGAQRGATFNQLIENYGHPTDAESFCRLAQWLNYEGHRAMFEANNVERQGLLMWMSHPCWPSMTWQTYDYFFDPGAAFFAIKSACEPLHVQFDSHRRRVQVVCSSLRPTPCHNPQSSAVPPFRGDTGGLQVRATVLDRLGRVESVTEEQVNIKEDTTTEVLSDLPLPTDSATHFLRLQLLSGKETVSDNTYLYNAHSHDYTDLTAHAPKAQVELIHVEEETQKPSEAEKLKNSNAQTLKNSKTQKLSEAEKLKNSKTQTLLLRNLSPVPALLVRLTLRDADGEPVLPAHYSDNYLHLMPHEERIVTIADTPAGTHVEATWHNQ